MTPEQTAEAISKAASQSGDPVFAGLAWVLGVLLMVLALAKPFMGLVRQYRSDKADNARDDADASVFQRLREEVERNSRDIRALIDEKNMYQKRTIELEAEINKLKESEAAIQRMKEKLDEKDRTISAQDRENRGLMREIIELKDRLHRLELRLSQDEKEFCRDCEHKRGTT